MYPTNNLDVRQWLKENDVPLWLLADLMHRSEATITRYFRREMSAEEKENIKTLVRTYKSEQAN